MTACDQAQTSLPKTISAVAHDAYRQCGASDIVERLNAAASIKVAEAAKVIENTLRDLNI
ncbi:MAG: hypothetical protein Q7S85_09955 [Rugosibacter sp.]|nr:hypothetical protein [Rugosibacter sp.]